MGYLRFKLRRSRCRAEIRAAYVRPLPAGLMEWVRASPQPPRGPRFVRLATDRVDEFSGEPLGVFQVAYELKRSTDLLDEHRDAIEPLLAWFCANLPAPKSVTPQAIFWMCCDAEECVGKLWELVRVLQRCGVRVFMMQTDVPGKIAYRDDLQVAAIPFYDPPTRAAACPLRSFARVRIFAMSLPDWSLRRQLLLTSFDEALSEVDRLLAGPCEQRGNWDLAQGVRSPGGRVRAVDARIPLRRAMAGAKAAGQGRALVRAEISQHPVSSADAEAPGAAIGQGPGGVRGATDGDDPGVSGVSRRICPAPVFGPHERGSVAADPLVPHVAPTWPSSCPCGSDTESYSRYPRPLDRPLVEAIARRPAAPFL